MQVMGYIKSKKKKSDFKGLLSVVVFNHVPYA